MRILCSRVSVCAMGGGNLAWPDLQSVGLVPSGQQNACLAQVAEAHCGKARPSRLRPRDMRGVSELLGRRGGHGDGQVARHQRTRRQDLAAGGQIAIAIAVAVAVFLRHLPGQQVLRPGNLTPQPFPRPHPIVQQLLPGTAEKEGEARSAHRHRATHSLTHSPALLQPVLQGRRDASLTQALRLVQLHGLLATGQVDVLPERLQGQGTHWRGRARRDGYG